MKTRQEIERLARRKQKNLLTLILLCVLFVSVLATVLVMIFLPEEEPENELKQPPEILEGEALYKNYAIAYPTMQESQIKTITVRNKESVYTLSRAEAFNNKFVLYYEDENGKTQVYYPDIVEADSSFDYESLYAIEQNDGYNRIYKLTYLCIALELPYFDERIALDTDETERERQLRRFGLDEPYSVSFEYTKEDGTTVNHRVKIGKKNVTGLGYYFMVDDRPYVYSSTANYYDYAILGFHSYVNSILVSKGLKEDSSYEPYLTTDFKQWVNQTYKEIGTEIPENSTVVFRSDMLIPLESQINTEINDETRDGYTSEGYALIEFDLSKHKGRKEFARLVNSLKGKKLGVLYDPEAGIGVSDDEIVVTLTSNSKALKFNALGDAEYSYSIFEIEALLTDSEDITAKGTPVGDNDLVRVAYYLTVNGDPVSEIPYHAVIDLSNPELPTDTVGKIRAASVGTLADNERIDLVIDYTKENANKVNMKCVIVELISVYDPEYKEIEKVAEDSIVTYRYKFVIDGVDQGTYYTAALNLGTDDTDTGAQIREKLLGKSPSKNLDIVAYDYTEYCEYLLDFITYRISSLDYFITSKLISSFRFQNNSNRDPFYGESLYENTMDNKYRLYGLNSSACEAVVKVLGGVGETTGQTDGLVGTETVAVGITPEIKEKYGLYANTVYFELPRGIIVIDSGSEEEIDDYTWYETLGFTLYISDEDPVTGMRYVGSDLYDIVATVSSDKLVFLNSDFVSFWARRNLMLIDVEHLSSIDVDFMMEDVKGSYDFDLNHRNLYLDANGSGHFTKPESYSDVYNFITVYVSSQCECDGECVCTANKMLDELKNMSSENKRMSLAQLYKKYLSKDSETVEFGSDGTPYIGNDTAGTSYFKEILEMLYYTQYAGSLTEAEQAEAIADSPMVMRLAVKLRSGINNASPYRYVYEFYRCDDRRVMVRLYQEDENGVQKTEAVSDFYISTLAFKKIVTNFYTVLNAEEFDTEEAYPEAPF